MKAYAAYNPKSKQKLKTGNRQPTTEQPEQNQWLALLR
jgi:hypothetical protein